MNFRDFTYIYFIGAGGIGMSALARYFMHLGFSCGGYDRYPSEMTDALEKEGMSIVFSDKVDAIPSSALKALEANRLLVVYTPAVPQQHPHVELLKSKTTHFYKRSEILGFISATQKTIAVAGTHGKTTTSTLIAHLLKEAGKNPFALLGGISGNYHTNFIAGTEMSVLVTEADEYDRSFLKLSPTIGVITSTDADHLDIYGNAEHVVEGYTLFAERIPQHGLLIKNAQANLNRVPECTEISYSAYEAAQIKLNAYEVNQGKATMNISVGNLQWEKLVLGQPGLHNAENALAAIAVVLEEGLNEKEIRSGLSSFSGVYRRFQYIINNEKVIFIDDYAHHPTELEAFISSVKTLYPSKKITGIFQPHLFSRTRDFEAGFVSSLSLLDCCILLDIYPARELPIEGVSSSVLLEKIKSTEKYLYSKEEVIEQIAQLNYDVLLTIGAGDIDQLVEPIKKNLLIKMEVPL